MPTTKKTTYENLSETAAWFKDVSRNAKKVARAYRKACRKALKAQRCVHEAIQSNQYASELGQEALGNCQLSPENDVPVIVTDVDSQKDFWQRWFNDQQAEMYAELSDSE